MQYPEVAIPAKFTRELWITATGNTSGDGTQASPLLARDGLIDPLLIMFGNDSRVTLLAGTYYTAGFRVPRRFMLSGASQSTTTLKLLDNVGTRNFSYPQVRMLADNGWSNLFIIQNLTLDGNWLGQGATVENAGFLISPLHVLATKAKAENIRVINFGSNGKNSPVGLECFPICFGTYSSGTPFTYDPVYQSLVSNPDDLTFVEITNCTVENAYLINGGYCTMIFVRTNYPGAGDRQPYGQRTNLAAVVRNNIVRGITGGIGYGSGVSEQIVFDGNIAIDCKCGFNIDTGEVREIQLLRNQFLRVNQGINLVPNPNSKNVTIERNVVTLTGPFFNPVTKLFEPFYYVNAANISSLVQKDNYVLTLGSQPLDVRS